MPVKDHHRRTRSITRIECARPLATEIFSFPEFYIKLYAPDRETLLYESEDSVRVDISGPSSELDVRVPHEALGEYAPRQQVRLIGVEGAGKMCPVGVSTYQSTRVRILGFTYLRHHLTAMGNSAWNDRIDRVTAYIQQNIEDIGTAKEVAQIVDVSYETLRKRFRQKVGMPIGKYMKQRRVDEARRLLIETDDPVYKVCRKVGYSSDSSGIRAFRRDMGITMGEYRRQYENEME